MGSLGYCEICGGENCTRGSVICCMSCGRPKETKVEPVKDLDQLLVSDQPEPQVAVQPARRRR